MSGCQDVLHLYRLLWASMVLNVLGLFLGIVTAAVLGAFKDMVSSAARPGQPQHSGRTRALGPTFSEAHKAGLVTPLHKWGNRGS